MEFKIGDCRIFISPLFVVLISGVLLIDKTGIMLFGLISVAIHEIGHLIFMILLGKYPKRVLFEPFGILITSRGFSTYSADLLVACGGCLFNFLAFIITFLIWFNNHNQFLILFCASNFGLLLFNLMPINGLDGMDIITLSLMRKYEAEKVGKICGGISVAFLIFSFICSFLFVYCFNLSLSVLICLVYLAFLTIITIRHYYFEK